MQAPIWNDRPVAEAPPRIVLASASRYRAELLERVLERFTCSATSVDESIEAGEHPREAAIRLARMKACVGAARHPQCLVIGSDQIADLDGRALGKPGSLQRAQAQLKECSGKTVVFHTALCIADTRNAACQLLEGLDTTRVVFRDLHDAEISRYLGRDAALDCAGSFKMERLGISLFERVDSTDPSAIIGLPLILLCRLLRQCGLEIP